MLSEKGKFMKVGIMCFFNYMCDVDMKVEGMMFGGRKMLVGRSRDRRDMGG